MHTFIPLYLIFCYVYYLKLSINALFCVLGNYSRHKSQKEQKRVKKSWNGKQSSSCSGMAIWCRGMVSETRLKAEIQRQWCRSMKSSCRGMEDFIVIPASSMPQHGRVMLRHDKGVTSTCFAVHAATWTVQPQHETCKKNNKL